MIKQRLLSGDTPTGRLHLGHLVGSIENRIQLQDDYDCYFMIANVQALTTRFDRVGEVHHNVIEVALDYLAAGIDPNKSTLFIQSEIPAIAELTIFFSMLIPYARIMRNPTIKEEIRDKALKDHYPFGFLLYPINQVADILTFRAHIVPVGEDQIPHLELTREIARRFNQLYCGVDPQTDDVEHLNQGGLFPIPQTLLGRTKRLVGTGAPGKDGKLLKMSKSLDNAIFLSDDADTIKKKVMSMYTDPRRIKATDKGSIDNNPLWIFHDIFNPDTLWVQEAKAKYQAGEIGDVMCKQRLTDVLIALITPIAEKRARLASDLSYVVHLLQKGAIKANHLASETLKLTKKAMQQMW